jgi:hypothetical protein
MMKALSFTEMSVLTRATGRNIPEDGILHSHRRETSNLPYCKSTTVTSVAIYGMLHVILADPGDGLQHKLRNSSFIG